MYIHEPLNLGYIAAYLLKNGYNDIKIHIGAFENDIEIINEVSNADIVGFTSTSPMMKHGEELAEKIKKENPNTIIIFGGSHPSTLPDKTLKNDSIDLVVRGEGEVTMLEVVKAVENNLHFTSIDGVSYKYNGNIKQNSTRKLIENIDIIPFPARKLMNQENFLKIGYSKYGDRGAWILSSRGCPYMCTYCASWNIWSRKWRARSPANVIKEIQDLINKFNVNRINFADDTFTISKKRVIEFCTLIKKKMYRYHGDVMLE